MSKDLIFNREAREKIQLGVDKLANAVKVTLGPRGRNVMIVKPYGAPIITKDGVSVARDVKLEDPFENAGAQSVKEVASRTADIAGDGTTTATVLAQAILLEGLKNVTAGASPIEIKRGIDAASKAVVEAIRAMSKKIETKEEVAQVGTISANNESEIGNIIAEAMDKVGKDGVIAVEETHASEMTLDFVEGMKIDRGFISPYFVNDPETMTAQFTDVAILIYDRKITNPKELGPIMEMCLKATMPLLVIADDVEGMALQMMAVNNERGVMKCCAIKAPGFGDKRKEMLKDIAVLTGATLIDSALDRQLSTVVFEDLGQARSVKVSKDSTTIIDGSGHPGDIQDRIAIIRAQADGTVSDFDREKLQERLARLAGGVAVINVGELTEAAMKEKKDRVEDALNATRAAVESGVVPGGGVALLRASAVIHNLDLTGDRKTGANIVLKACEAPLWQIATNAGSKADAIVERVKTLKGNMGYNAHTEKYEDLIASGVIDPAKVTITALENAASIAGLLLTTDCIIAEKKQDAGAEMAGM